MNLNKPLSHDLPTLNLPLDYPRSQASTKMTHQTFQPLQLEESFYSEINRFAEQQNVTPFIVLLTTLKILLHRYTGQDDIVVGSLSMAEKLENQSEQLNNPITLRTLIPANAGVKELLTRLRQTVHDAMTSRDDKPAPVFQAMLVEYQIEMPSYQPGMAKQAKNAGLKAELLVVAG
jgi:hypothetical protein